MTRQEIEQLKKAREQGAKLQLKTEGTWVTYCSEEFNADSKYRINIKDKKNDK